MFSASCPHCYGKAGLVYTRHLKSPVSCEVCLLLKANEGSVGARMKLADLRKPLRALVTPEFIAECKANTERWTREREELLKGTSK